MRTQAIDAARPPAKVAPNAASETAGVAQPLTPNLDLPAKPSVRSSARVVAAKTDTTAPSAATETPSRPVQLGTPVRSEKAARVSPKALQAAGRAAGDAAGPPHAFAEPPVNPMASALARVFGELVGALALASRLGRSTGRAKIGDRSQERPRAAQRQIFVRAQRRGNRRA